MARIEMPSVATSTVNRYTTERQPIVVKTGLQEIAISVANLDRKLTEFGKAVQNPQRLKASAIRLPEFRSC